APLRGLQRNSRVTVAFLSGELLDSRHARGRTGRAGAIADSHPRRRRARRSKASGRPQAAQKRLPPPLWVLHPALHVLPTFRFGTPSTGRRALGTHHAAPSANSRRLSRQGVQGRLTLNNMPDV